jgi:hypothetical protein
MNIEPVNLFTQFNDVDNPKSKEGISEYPIKKAMPEKKKPRELTKSVRDMTYITYYNNNIQLSKFKIDELKHISKKHGLKYSGTKKVLIERIEKLFHSTKPAVKIQSAFRKWTAVECLNMRGPAVKNRNLCVNDTDFVSMEPIKEIPNELFYSYQDDKDFIYGFNVSSLIQVLQKNLSTNEQLENPYNREVVDSRITLQILRLYRFCFIVHNDFKKENQKFIKYSQTPATIFRAPPLIHRNVQHLNDTNHFRNANVITFTDYEPIVINNYQMTADQYARINLLREIRNMTVTQRTNNLFVEIDHLGNYTQASWFNLLERNEYIIFYRFIYEIWYYRANFARDVRYNICPFLTPFYNVTNIRNIAHTASTSEIKQLCLIVFENLVYTGSDDEHRKLGAMHALSALTTVSIGARGAMPWLYESVTF